MPRGTKIMRSFADWPAEDQERWNHAFKPADRFEETSLGAHLAPATRKARRESYGRFLGFIAAFYPGRLARPPDTRIDRATLAEYVAWRSRSSEKSALVCDLRALRDGLKLICPDADWSWLLGITKRMAAGAQPSRTKYHLVTSDRLYLLGIELMDRAVAQANARRQINKADAFCFRDGLIICLLAMIPLRSRSLTALRIGQHLVKASGVWTLDIPAADTKTRRAAGLSDFPGDFGANRSVPGAISQPYSWRRQTRGTLAIEQGQANGFQRHLSRRVETHEEGLRVWRKFASIPSCSSQLLGN